MHGSLCVADEQSQGRGRADKHWFGDKTGSLMFSLGWAPSVPVGAELSLLVGVALVDALFKLGYSGLGLKWPNDVLVGAKKLAGILVESRHTGAQAEYVIGVGLNLSLSLDQLSRIPTPSVSLAQLSETKISKQTMLVALLTELANRLDQRVREGFAPIRRDWITYHAQKGARVNYQAAGQTHTATIRGIDQHGALLLDQAGEQRRIVAGEIHTVRNAA